MKVREKFIETLVLEKKNAVVFLINGVKLTGLIVSEDNGDILLERDGNTQVVYGNAISTVSIA